MSASYDVLAAIDMARVAGHPVSGGVAQRGDAARNVLGNRQALVRIALACDLDQIFVAGDETEGGDVGNPGQPASASKNALAASGEALCFPPSGILFPS
jgi:hypothetical protein